MRSAARYWKVATLWAVAGDVDSDVDSSLANAWNPRSPERVPDQFRRLEQEAEANMSNAESNYKTIRARLERMRAMLNDALAPMGPYIN